MDFMIFLYESRICLINEFTLEKNLKIQLSFI